MKPPTLAIVVPCKDEEAALPLLQKILPELLGKLVSLRKIGIDSFVLYVDDGSSDGTWQLIKHYTSENCKGIKLSRNFGHQYALIAGIEYVSGKCDCCVTIDADLQDNPAVIEEMVDKFNDGAEIVYGVRSRRDSDRLLKRWSARGYYSLLRHLGVDNVYDHADFRLLGSRAMESLLEFGERNMFLRGIVPLLGFRQEKVYYTRSSRVAGRSKYPFGRMLEFAADGVTSFSVRPVRMLFWLGILFMVTALGVGIYAMVRHLEGETIVGWTSLILSIWFCTGILLMGLGILGEYVGKIYIEVKKRPRYKIIEESKV